MNREVIERIDRRAIEVFGEEAMQSPLMYGLTELEIQAMRQMFTAGYLAAMRDAFTGKAIQVLGGQ